MGPGAQVPLGSLHSSSTLPPSTQRGPYRPGKRSPSSSKLTARGESAFAGSVGFIARMFLEQTTWDW